MAEFNQLFASPLNEALRRRFALEEGQVSSIAPEIMPSYDLNVRPEDWALLGGDLLMGFQNGVAAGGAGFRSQSALDNPASSRKIVILEKLYFGTGTAEALELASSQTSLSSSTGNLVCRDLRRATTAGGSGPFAARIRNQNNAALTGTASALGRIRARVGVIDVISLELVLAPGWSMRVYPLADNTAINSELVYMVRERPATPYELEL